MLVTIITITFFYCRLAGKPGGSSERTFELSHEGPMGVGFAQVGGRRGSPHGTRPRGTVHTAVYVNGSPWRCAAHSFMAAFHSWSKIGAQRQQDLSFSGMTNEIPRVQPWLWGQNAATAN